MSDVTLEELLAHLPQGVPLPVGCWLVEQIAGAIASAPRPITPIDVLIADDGTISLAQRRARPPFSYRAPETLRGASGDERAAVWALGVLLVETVTGRAPFKRDSDLETRIAVSGEPVPPLAGRLPEATHDLDAIVQRALAKKPESRFGSIEEMATRIEAFLDDEMHEVGSPQLAAVVRAAATGKDPRGALFAAGFAPPSHGMPLSEPKVKVPPNAPVTDPPPRPSTPSSGARRPEAPPSKSVIGHPQLHAAPVGVATSSPMPSYEDAKLDLAPRHARSSHPAQPRLDSDLVRLSDPLPDKAKAGITDAALGVGGAPRRARANALDVDEAVLRLERSRHAHQEPEPPPSTGGNWIVRIVIVLAFLLALALAYQFVLRPLLR